MILQISQHAKEKIDIEGIDEEQIKRAIKMGSISRQTDGYLATYTYINIAYKSMLVKGAVNGNLSTNICQRMENELTDSAKSVYPLLIR